MIKTNSTESARLSPRIFLSFILCSAGVLLAFAGATKQQAREVRRERYMPVAGEKGEDLNKIEQEWNDRLTYPTGIFNPEWIRAAVSQDSLITRAVPLGVPLSKAALAASPLALSTSSFTSLGPTPIQMSGCSGCYDYTKTEGRVNAIVVDPTIAFTRPSVLV